VEKRVMNLLIKELKILKEVVRKRPENLII
jgi:hypothetical protein